MGPRNSKQTTANFMSDYQVIQKNQSESLTYLQHKRSEEEFLLRQFNFNDKKQCEKTLEKLGELKNKLSGNKHVVPLRDYITSSEDQYCSTFYKIFALFEYPQRTLDDEINERNLQKRKFSETQLWSILASCILGLSHLQKNGIKHLSLKSSNILLSQEGIIKIADPFATGCQTNYDTCLTKRSTPHLYLSPQQASSLQQQLISPVINPFKSDIWTLGMIILEAGLLQYQDECYRDEMSRIHWETLQYNINRFGQQYSEEIKNMIEFMLSRDEKARPDWVDLEQHVMKSDEGKRSFIQEQSVSINNNYPNQNSGVTKKLTNYPPPQTISSQRVSGGFVSIPNKVNGQQIQSNISPRNQTSMGQFVISNRTSQLPVNNAYPSPRISGGFRQPTITSGHDFIAAAIIKPSIIEQTRPLRNIFPTDSYFSKTRVDENLIMVQDQDQESSRGFVQSSPTYSNNTKPFTMARRETYQQNRNIANQPNQQYRMASQSSPNRDNAPQSHPYLQATNNNYSTNNYYEQSEPRISNQHSREDNSSVSNNQQFVVEKFKMGSRYEGYKVRGMRHGHGKFYYQDGGMYDGQWNQNKMEGYGKLYYQSGKLAYEGNWKADQFMGDGVLHNEVPDQLDGFFNYENMEDVEDFWVKYEGQFADDMKNGHGTLFLSNGQKFEGQFESDAVQGYGVFYRKNGETVSGRWSSNIKVS